MLKELFEAHFYATFPKKHGVFLQVDECTYQDYFSLVDISACRGCHFVCNIDLASREQLKVHSNMTTNVVNLAQVFNYVQEEIGETCDYMLESGQAVALVEMTCTSFNYIKDKRQKARSQLRNTLTLLHTNPDVRCHIESLIDHYAVFSWRETFNPTISDSVAQSMTGMLEMTDEVYSPFNESKFDFDFRLREVRYPDCFEMA